MQNIQGPHHKIEAAEDNARGQHTGWRMGEQGKGDILAATVIHVLVGSVLRMYGVLYNTAHACL